MAFPTTPVLTTFPGANEEPLSEGGAWGGTLRATSASINPCRLVSNQCGPSTIATNGSSESVWATSFAEDQEIFVTQTAAPGAGGPALWIRVQQEGAATVDGYNLSYILGTGLQFYRIQNAGFTQLTPTVAQVVGAGDAIGLSVSGTTLEGWYKASGGSWVSIGTRTDATVTGAGKIGLSISGGPGTTTRLDDFGGGETTSVAAPSDDPPIGFLGRGAGW